MPEEQDGHPAPLMAVEEDLPEGPDKGLVSIGYLSGTSVSNEFLKSLLRLKTVDTEGDYRHLDHPGWWINQRSGVNVASTRNRLVRTFLAMRNPAPEWLLMVDADMGFEPTALELLLRGTSYPDRLVIGGLCVAFGNDPSGDPDKIALMSTVFDAADPAPGIEIDKFKIVAQKDVQRHAIREVYGTGAAMLLVHRQVLIDVAVMSGMQFPWFREIVAPDTREGVPWAERNDYWISEDLFFCLACHQAGHRVFVHTGVEVEHIKEIRLTEKLWRSYGRIVQPA